MKKKIEELFRLAMKAQEKTSAFVSFETSNHGWGCVVMIMDDGFEVKHGYDHEEGYDGCKWEDVNIDCDSETLKELALYPGEPEAYCYIDSTEGEYLPISGGSWLSTSSAGVFIVHLSNPRTSAYGGTGFRSAYFRKLKTE